MSQSTFETLAAFWALTEEKGSNPEMIEGCQAYLQSPALVLGSGQGLVSEALVQRGLEVDSVDISPVMADYAMKRRGLSTFVADATTYASTHPYNTIVVSTGVLTAQNIDTSFLKELLGNIRSLLAPDGVVLFSYFCLEAWRVEAEALGWTGAAPSAGRFFWEGRGDLGATAALFSRPVSSGGGGFPQEATQAFFATYTKELTRYCEMVQALGEACLAHHEDEPMRFLGQVLAGDNIQLSPTQEEALESAIEASGGQIEERLTFQEGRLGVRVFRRLPLT